MTGPPDVEGVKERLAYYDRQSLKTPEYDPLLARDALAVIEALEKENAEIVGGARWNRMNARIAPLEEAAQPSEEYVQRPVEDRGAARCALSSTRSHRGGFGPSGRKLPDERRGVPMSAPTPESIAFRDLATALDQALAGEES